MLPISATSLLRLFYGALLIQLSSTTVARGSEGNSTDMGLLGGDNAAAPKKGHVPLDVDGYPVAPVELELEQVHIYVRHGTFPPYVVMTVQSARM